MVVLALVVGIVLGLVLAVALKLSRQSSPKMFETMDRNTPRCTFGTFCSASKCLEYRLDEWTYCRRHLIAFGYLVIKPYEFDFANKPPVLQLWKGDGQ